MSFLPSRPDASLMDAFRLVPDIAGPLHGFAEALMRGPSPLSPAQRELIAAHVSAINGCAFCRASHAEAARRLGVEAGALERLLERGEDDGFAAPERALLAYARKLTETPAAVTEADARAVLAAGWDETALHHAALVAGFFALMNRWVEGLGIEADPKMVEMAGSMLSTKGYAVITEMLER